ncbi:MAG: cation-translocating P-type ATPase [Actinomycetota bacterium]
MTDELDLNSIKGLSKEEAAERLIRDGYNELPSSKPRSLFAIAFDVLHEPMFLLLIAAGSLYLVFGDLEEAILLLSFVFVVIGITFYQERRTERALEALRDLSSPRALVIRDGEQQRIAGRDVVRGDILVLSEGDRVPADAIILSSNDFLVDESMLTGESVPVRKKASQDLSHEIERPGGENLPFVYSGTLVVRGQGIAQVKSTGAHTELGKIGKTLSIVGREETPLQKKTGRLVRNLAIMAFFLAVLVVVAYGITRGNWLDGSLAGITLAMAAIPEEIPVVLVVFLALGAWRISKKQVLTRRVPAVETLGETTVLCVDKTGTLTLNRMSVKRIFSGKEFFDVDYHSDKPLPEEFHQVVEFSILASEKDPFDPMEKAFKELGEHYLAQTEHLHSDWALVREYPLSEELLAISHVWRSPNENDYIIATKGAPEAIADLCHFSDLQMQELSKYIASMANDGLRVLGVAKASFKRTKEASLPGEQHDYNFKFLGLVGLADPIRQTVPQAIKECYDAGIRVVMITGDYPGTAQSIARQIGLTPADKFITGQELEKMGDLELQWRIRDVNIFARVVPEQKLRLVNALKANGEIVAMTGDGVNDAPALRAADIGIAMGARGTDVAREAAALVLLDDDFASIVQAVRSGRRIFDNIRKALAYIFAIHVPIIGMSLIPVLFNLPLVLLPVHIVFLELIIDPASSIVFEAEPDEADLMKRPPRNPQEPLFGKRIMGLSMLQGIIVLTVLLAVFGISLHLGHSPLDARALTFTTLIIANLGLIFTNRSWSKSIISTLKMPNAALWFVVGGALVFLILVLYVPFLSGLFHFTFLHPIDIVISLTAGIVSVLWFEGLKSISSRHRRPLDQEVSNY